MSSLKQPICVSSLLLCLLLLTEWAQAQLPSRPNPSTDIPQQSVYLELGGNGIYYSLNYDVLFSSGWGFRLGGGYYPPFLSERDYISNVDDTNAFLGLVMGQRSFGVKAHKLEVGAGLLFGTIYEKAKWDAIEPPGASFSLGYRYYPEESSRVTFKAAFTPVISKSGFHPRVGISLGITLTPEGDAKIR